MTIQEIKDIFGIDITDKKRTELNVYLKTLYVEQNKSQKSILQLSKDLNCSHSTLLYNLKTLDTYNLDPLFMYVVKAFKTKDINLIQEYKNLQLERVAARKHLTYAKFITKRNLEKPKRFYKEHYKGEEDRISNDFTGVKRVGILEVAENLRFIKTNLNDKPFTAWTGRDWSNYYNLIK
jgi:dephospho-CoA kinase